MITDKVLDAILSAKMPDGCTVEDYLEDALPRRSDAEALGLSTEGYFISDVRHEMHRSFYKLLVARIMSAIEPAGVGVETVVKAVMEAIVSCGHEIDHDAVVLKFSERQKGHNAYNQLNTRVRNALAKALATEEGNDNG